ncbi:MAG: hypothetical protein DRP47_04525 [Candidatus Zixiibacteriota bacterium]|nr:MAG: hypothetical protein DRP47_04525 [candidate division Zixibacteria bacterium]
MRIICVKLLAMKLCLRDIDAFPARVCLKADPDSFKINYDGVFGTRQVEVDLDIQKSGDEFFCQADVRGIVVLECARCLEHYEAELTSIINFIVCSKATYDEFRKEAEDDETYIFYRGEEQAVDISEIVRQSIMLAVPMMPICSDDCKGLCPTCGINLNLHDCDCSQEHIDERWEGLRDLRDR